VNLALLLDAAFVSVHAETVEIKYRVPCGITDAESVELLGAGIKEFSMLEELTKTILLLVAALFPVINPPASGFIVLSMVPEADESELTELAWRITLNSFLILLISLYFGAYVLSFFGISIPVLRVAGGVVLGIAGWDLLNSGSIDNGHEQSSQREAQRAGARAASLRAKSFYPLTLPITVGPGSIAVTIALATGSPKDGPSFVHFLGVAIALTIICVSIYLSTRFAARLQKLLGSIGSEVAMRLFAFILFCIGVQIFWLGLSALLESLHL
jgi:multiple antibiotic resistance protein